MTKRKLKTVIICRTNGPLMKMGADLRRRCPGMKQKFLGRDIAKALKDTVIEVLEWRRNVGIDEFRVLLESWITEVRNKYKDKDGKETIWGECEDAYDQIKILSENCADARAVMVEIDNTFIDADDLEEETDENIVVFASGHRSKGLEWERTILIRFDLMPHPNAETEADLQQEEHLKYVAGTRAKEIMYVCHDKRPDPKADRAVTRASSSQYDEGE
jgi:superfamily I DNA/RNA helicase